MKNLTIIAIDTAYHDLTKLALESTIEITGSNNVLVFSNKDILSGSQLIQIEPISISEYSRIVFKDLAQYVNTDHYLIVQHDGFPTDATKWTDEFLKYDYIGATWPWLPENKNVGNGGFSLRSKKLSETLLRPEITWDAGLSPAEDEHVCKIYRNYLETLGIKFAPSKVANKFSAENPGGKFDTFGFHGTLCLPYYASDNYLEFYINQLDEKRFKNDKQIRIIYGLYCAQRYDLMEQMMDRGCELIPDFKKIVLDQYVTDKVYFPLLTMEELVEVLVNY